VKLLALLLAVQLLPVDQAGYRKLIESNRGKVVLVDFWATWCDPCREELPRLAALEGKLRGRGFVLVTVSADEPEQESAAHAFLRKSGVRLPAWRKQSGNDQDFINSIDPKWSGALPALFLYDRRGRKVRSFIGETEPQEIEAAVSKLL
jgi:thiol-disulfide isomerase/thioredoxin